MIQLCLRDKRRVEGNLQRAGPADRVDLRMGKALAAEPRVIATILATAGQQKNDGMAIALVLTPF
jgi:hypothetical protein